METLTSTSRVEYRVFEACGEPCGVVVWEPVSGQLDFLFRRDWDAFAGEDAGIVQAIAEDLPGKAREMGAAEFLRWAGETLSNTFRIGDSLTSLAGAFDRTLHLLYRRHVRSEVREYTTHLPLWDMALAAGPPTEDSETGVSEWVEVHASGRRSLGRDFFVARIKGRSMEPDIPDGSLCLFREYKGGSRRGGGIWIIQELGDSTGGGMYTLKRYDSDWQETAEGRRQTRITMQADNPEFGQWDLETTGRNYRTIAQFIRVLEDPAP